MLIAFVEFIIVQFLSWLTILVCMNTSQNITPNSSSFSENVLCHHPPNHPERVRWHHWASRPSQAQFQLLALDPARARARAQAPTNPATHCHAVRSCWNSWRLWRMLLPGNEQRSQPNKRKPALGLFASLPACAALWAGETVRVMGAFLPAFNGRIKMLYGSCIKAIV